MQHACGRYVRADAEIPLIIFPDNARQSLPYIHPKPTGAPALLGKYSRPGMRIGETRRCDPFGRFFALATTSHSRAIESGHFSKARQVH
jgi:hypothetical protein